MNFCVPELYNEWISTGIGLAIFTNLPSKRLFGPPFIRISENILPSSYPRLIGTEE